MRWAREEFGRAELGDVRRVNRLVAMAAGASQRPSGKVSVVFDRPREREGAYDFLESAHVDELAVAKAMFAATAGRAEAEKEKTVFVPLDISSLTLTDDAETKDFGVLGASNRHVRGVLMVNALAVSREGVPLGLIDQQYWTREKRREGTLEEKVKANLHRPIMEKQGGWFLRSVERVIERFADVDVTPWFVIDREADSRHILGALRGRPCLYTIRATRNRSLAETEKASTVRAALLRSKPLAKERVDLSRNGHRAARTVDVEIRAKQVELAFKKMGISPAATHRVYAVWVRERTRGRKKSEPLDWLLYTNAPVVTEEDARRVVASYRARWRVEEFHRTWKKGECAIETTQLRSLSAVVKWATVLAAVAVRIERLKYLSRATPNAPASAEFADVEIAAMKLEREIRADGRPVQIPVMPSLQQATEWVAELGGWMGRQNGPPGSITLARGLDRLSTYVLAIRTVDYQRRGKSLLK